MIYNIRLKPGIDTDRDDGIVWNVIDLLAEERKLVYKRKGQVDTVQAHKKARARTMAQ